MTIHEVVCQNVCINAVNKIVLLSVFFNALCLSGVCGVDEISRASLKGVAILGRSGIVTQTLFVTHIISSSSYSELFSSLTYFKNFSFNVSLIVYKFKIYLLQFSFLSFLFFLEEACQLNRINWAPVFKELAQINEVL